MSVPAAKKSKGGVERVTCTAPVNIAVIKYWGKRDEELLLPINSSLSGTLSQDELHARTTVAAGPFGRDQIWLNGVEEDINNDRLQNCLREIRARLKQRDPSHHLLTQNVRICSVNNFPTAAGLASSAAGYACLVAALAHLFEVEQTELSSIARVGSGSACRSMFGGFVRWTRGEIADGSDSVASQVAPESHWPEMQVLVLVVNAGRKTVSSTSGMQTSVETSALIKHRADIVVPQRMAEMEAAIEARDFETFGRLTMQDSNQFHAVCLDTYPPIFYMNDISRQIVQILTRYNASGDGRIKAAYTYDAGPNCVIYCLKDKVPEILSLVHEFFPPGKDVGPEGFYRGRTTEAPAPLSEELKAAIPAAKVEGGIKYVLHTGIGAGPLVKSDEESFLLDEQGNPKAL